MFILRHGTREDKPFLKAEELEDDGRVKEKS